ncbi:hypothetical protein HK097_000145 [Rhizophlyctis rosea]|uniref:Uncharacterized protein n=1 Tax=Rhizophlyctis rosea TaxID=64517 RepID=A0AAD5S7R1_9FUNG|nr:hypothetical protein HK097_000145 [Rhizophlyctis rosea]
MRDAKSADKAYQFFGEGSIPIQVGKGSTEKLRRVYGTGGPSTPAYTDPSAATSSSALTAAAAEPGVASASENSTLESRRRGPRQSWSSAMTTDTNESIDLFESDVEERHDDSEAGTVIDGEADTSTDLLPRINSVTSVLSIDSNLTTTTVPTTPHFLPPQFFTTQPPLQNPSTRKIESIMGVACPVDVSLREIERSGAIGILQSRIPLCWFLAFLLKNSGEELLFFLHDTTRFSTTPFPTVSSLRTAAHQICNTYLVPTSPMPIPPTIATHAQIRAVADAVKVGTSLRCFDGLQNDVMKGVEEAFGRFREGKMWEEMKDVVGYSQLPNPNTINRTKSLLRNAYQTRYGAGTTPASGLDEVQHRKRAEAVGNAVADVCRDVGIGLGSL